MANNTILKNLRITNGFTQTDMASMLNMAVNTYNRKELGIREFTLQECKLISEFFGKSIEEIFFNSKCNTNDTQNSA